MITILNPLVQQLIGVLIRVILVGISGEATVHAYENGEIDEMAKALAPGLIAVGWSMFNAYKGRKKLVTAMSLSTPVSENQLNHIIAQSTNTPPVTLAKTEVATDCANCGPMPPSSNLPPK